jgi:hypothetical protein
MRVSKAQLRREKMQVFNRRVQEERERLLNQNLGAQELVELFDYGNFFIELAASGLLLEKGKAAGMEVVLKGLEHPQWKVRRTCADFLDHWGDQRCIAPLSRLLRDPKENVRRLALHSLLPLPFASARPTVLIESRGWHPSLRETHFMDLIDLDLQILAARPEKYDLYAIHVRAEYDWVSDADFMRGRADFLKRMLARQRIFTNADLEAPARANMTREYDRLSSL